MADVIVVGGGPAGSMAAWVGARAGLDVLLLERGDPERDKLCSGVIAPHTEALLRELPVDLDACTLGIVQATEIRSRLGTVLHRHRPFRMVARSRFDLALRRAAEAAGARVLHGQRVVAVTAHGVQTMTGERHGAPVVIGAEGAGGPCARYVGGPHVPCYVAMEARVETERPAVTVLDWRAPGGYAWLFRKARSVGVGVMVPPEGADVRSVLGRWSREIGIDAASARGHLIPRALRRRLVRDGVMLTGDAAGAVDPLLGEGIPWALRTGRLAGEMANAHIRDGVPLALYEQRLRREVRRGLRFARVTAWMRLSHLDPVLELMALGWRLPGLRRWMWDRMLG